MNLWGLDCSSEAIVSLRPLPWSLTFSLSPTLSSASYPKVTPPCLPSSSGPTADPVSGPAAPPIPSHSHQSPVPPPCLLSLPHPCLSVPTAPAPVLCSSTWTLSPSNALGSRFSPPTITTRLQRDLFDPSAGRFHLSPAHSSLLFLVPPRTESQILRLVFEAPCVLTPADNFRLRFHSSLLAFCFSTVHSFTHSFNVC